MLDVVLVELARGQIFWRDLLLICGLFCSSLAIRATLILDAAHCLEKERAAKGHARHRSWSKVRCPIECSILLLLLLHICA